MERLFGAIPGILKEMSATAAAQEAVAFAAWNDVAGEMIRERTFPLELFERRLIVAVEDLNWQRQLEDLASRFVVKLNALMGQDSIRFIEFRIEPTAIKRGRATLETASDETDADPKLVAAAANITDERLRRTFLEAATAYLDAK